MYWFDYNIIKAFTKQGELVNLYKVKISDDLSIQIVPHKDYKKSIKNQFETWEETIQRNKERLNQIELKSIKFLQTYSNTDNKIICLNSTGKDSMVVYQLANKAGLDFETYFNITTLDVADSNIMAKELGFKFIFPEYKKGFYNYIKEYKIMPTRFSRFCCSVFKENPTIKYFNKNDKILFLLGMRNDESSKRADYQDVLSMPNWSKNWLGLLPIREWTELDVWLYLLREKIKINSKYKKGYNRVGCGIACPYYTKTTWVLDKYWFPHQYNKWRRLLKEDFINASKWTIMNCTVDEYVQKYWCGGTAYKQPTKDCIDEFIKYSRLNKNVAEKFFNHSCSNGCMVMGKAKQIKNREVIAMNMKYFGRNTTQFKCKKCLMREFNWTNEDWNNQVKEFKSQGCTLF